MIDIKNKIDCCGCNACGDICPTDAITFKTDIEGFWYPEVNLDKCINCHLCEKTCPQIHYEELKHNEFKEPKCFAAINKNIEVRFDSTSGGMFSAIADHFYKQGGYVGGAIFNEDWSVSHFISNDKKDLPALRSSKYLQSDASGFYKAVRDLVKVGEKVMVCGTPCQMGALRRFLGKDYDNLLIVDFICRGINSPKVFRKYLDYLEERFGAKVTYFKAKNKELGWRQLTSKVGFSNGKFLYDTKDTSLFTIGYLQTNVYCRPSCYDCKFKGFPRMADITVADYWGAEKTVGKDLDNDLGTSLVLINNNKGMGVFNEMKSSLNYASVPFDSILKGNPALTTSLNPPLVNRDEFYKALDKEPFKKVADTFIKTPNEITIKRKIKNVLGFGYHVLRVSKFNLPTLWKNIKYNFLRKNIDSDILKKKYILIYPHSTIQIHKESTIKLNGVFLFGYKRIKDSKLESRLLVEKGAQLTVGEKGWNIFYGADVEIFSGGKVNVNGGGANINFTLVCSNEITLGDSVEIGRNVTMRDNNGNHFIAIRGYKENRPIKIDHHAWLCEGCLVMPGVKIGEGAIIGARSVVATSIPAFSISSGDPAKVLETNVIWKY